MNSSRPTCILVISNDPARGHALEQLIGHEADIRLVLADTVSAVAQLSQTESIDLVLFFPAADEPELGDAARHCIDSQAEPPALVVAIAADDAATALALAEQGVDGFVSTANGARLRQILLNQIERLKTRRRAFVSAEKLAEIENRHSLLLNHSSEAIAYLHQGLHVFANPAYLATFGLSFFEEIEGLSVLDLLEAEPGETDLRQLLKALSLDALPGRPIRLRGRHPDGRQFPVSAVFSSARYNGEDCAQVMIRHDRADHEPVPAEERHRLEQTDSLTGFLNRSAFMARLTDEVDRLDETRCLQVLLLSLDQLGRVQGPAGKDLTDTLIQKTGELLVEISGDALAIARLGDQQFALLFESASPALACQVLQHCQGGMLEIGEHSLPITVSVGIARAHAGQCSAENLLAQAEIALNEAIRSGGNAYASYLPRDGQQGPDNDQAWSERLHHTLLQGGIQLVATPVLRIDGDTRVIHEVEPCMRNESSDEVIRPAVFLAAAARVGLAVRFDEELLQRLPALLTSPQVKAGEAWLITLSSAAMEDAGFRHGLANWLLTAWRDPSRLILGFRDAEIEDKLRPLQGFIHQFRTFGCRFAVTEVGPDSRLAWLQEPLQLAYVRLAPEMIRNLGHDPALHSKLASLVEATKPKRMDIIAPRVSQASRVATLWQLGISWVQGELTGESARTLSQRPDALIQGRVAHQQLLQASSHATADAEGLD